MEWKNLNINKNQIKYETDKAVMVQMPNNSSYKGYCFWHTKKLIKEGRNSNTVKLIYNDDFIFKLKKDDDVVEIEVEEFEDIFNVINENISTAKKVNYFETHKPKEIEVKEVEVLEELKDE